MEGTGRDGEAGRSGRDAKGWGCRKKWKEREGMGRQGEVEGRKGR